MKNSKLKKSTRNFIIIVAAFILVGLCFIVIGAATGGVESYKEYKNQKSIGSSTEIDEEDSNDDISLDLSSDTKNIVIEYAGADIVLEEGDKFEVKVTNTDNVETVGDIENSDGTIYITGVYAKSHHSEKHKSGDNIPEVIITYPAGTEFDKVTINADYDVKCVNLKAKEYDINSKYGEVTYSEE